MDEMKLLNMLIKDPTAQVTDLADILGESEETVRDTKKSLEDKKIICGYHTVVNWDKANIDHVDAIIAVKASTERGVGYDKIAEKIGRFPEVTDLYLVSGASEFMVNLSSKTMKEVADFVGQKLAPIQGVYATETMFVLKKYKVDEMYMDLDGNDSDERQIVSA